MKTILKLIAALLLITVLFSIGYFAYRASQPMVMPEFKGLTGYQLMKWRYWEFARMEMEQIVYHPGTVKFLGKHATERTNLCFMVDAPVTGMMIPAQSFAYTIAGLGGAKPDASHAIPTGVAYSNFMDKWWRTMEDIQWYNAKSSHVTMSVIYCRINHADMPSAEIFNASIEKLKARVAELEAINDKRNAAQARE